VPIHIGCCDVACCAPLCSYIIEARADMCRHDLLNVSMHRCIQYYSAYEALRKRESWGGKTLDLKTKNSRRSLCNLFAVKNPRVAQNRNDHSMRNRAYTVGQSYLPCYRGIRITYLPTRNRGKHIFRQGATEKRRE
jgi:hypothetical protein